MPASNMVCLRDNSSALVHKFACISVVCVVCVCARRACVRACAFVCVTLRPPRHTRLPVHECDLCCVCVCALCMCAVVRVCVVCV